MGRKVELSTVYCPKVMNQQYKILSSVSLSNVYFVYYIKYKNIL